MLIIRLASVTHVSSSAAQSAASQPVAKRSVRARVFAFAAVAVAADFVTKQAAVTFLEGEPPVQVLGPLLRLWVGRNPGAAFSIGDEGSTLVFTAIAVAAIAGLTVWMPRIIASIDSPLMAPVVSLAVAGAAGNLIDRVFRSPGIGHGHVVDFIALPNFPIFNVSDMCITAAAALYICANVGASRRAATAKSRSDADE